MTEQLKPCPFCGGAAHFFKITDLDDKNFGGEGICCGSCPITTDLMFSLMEDCKPKLAEAWNRRAQPAQAVPVLTESELRSILQGTNHMVKNAMHGAFWPELEEACRAIEQAVRAKMGVAVPMTLKQIIHLTDEIPLHEGGGWFVDVVRAAERFHGIVGKEGA